MSSDSSFSEQVGESDTAQFVVVCEDCGAGGPYMLPGAQVPLTWGECACGGVMHVHGRISEPDDDEDWCDYDNESWPCAAVAGALHFDGGPDA